MKVKELIQKLNMYDKESEVIIRFALDIEDEIGYVLNPKILGLYGASVAIYSNYEHTLEDCNFIGQIDLKKAYEHELEKSNINKTADKLFEEIEYEKVKDDEKSIIYEKWLNGYANQVKIYFDKTHHTVCGTELDEDYECNEPLGFGVKELQAINKKCQELGWVK